MHRSLKTKRIGVSQPLVIQSPRDKNRLLDTEYIPPLDKNLLGLIERLRKSKVIIEELWLFGSRARGDFNPASDYDIFCIWDDQGKGGKVNETLNFLAGYGFQIFGRSRRDFERYFPRLCNGFDISMLSFEGVLFYWKDEQTFLKAKRVSPRFI
ncbi:MAG: nucleotidyltransferase domain-containing protein [Betaproteobacteria bacterium]|nr:nucleotidyltransferase domain-containing protein [Betaproteobacteria bacterium]